MYNAVRMLELQHGADGAKVPRQITIVHMNCLQPCCLRDYSLPCLVEDVLPLSFLSGSARGSHSTLMFAIVTF